MSYCLERFFSEMRVSFRCKETSTGALRLPDCSAKKNGWDNDCPSHFLFQILMLSQTLIIMHALSTNN